MRYETILKTLDTELNKPVIYSLNIINRNFDTIDTLNLTNKINTKFKIEYVGEICIYCKRNQNLFKQGYCKNCFYTSPLTSKWITSPELSTAHLDIEDRDIEYEKKIQLSEHIVYLSFTSDIKVGVTVNKQIPYRWINQGANSIIKIFKTPNRYLAGLIEVELKKYFKDKTNWRKMLTNNNYFENFIDIKNKTYEYISDNLKEYFIEDNDILNLEFPIIEYPVKPVSINLNKTNNSINAILKGIKGQYLIFDNNMVFNISNNQGKIIILEMENL